METKFIAAVKDIEAVFGICLKEHQKCATRQLIVGRKNVFVNLPTGFGKTYCYAFLPHLYSAMERPTIGCVDERSIVIVLSPLIALMKDQCKHMEQLGIKAAFIGEGQKDSSVKKDVKTGSFQLLFASPECMLSPTWRLLLVSPVYKSKLRALVIDEAHCISQWYSMLCFLASIIFFK